MEVMIRERFDFRNVSAESRARALQTAVMMDNLDGERRVRDSELRPLCPDNSGEVGAYDDRASKWFKTAVFVTQGKWPENKYFTWDEDARKGHVIKAFKIEDYLKYCTY